MRKINLVFGLVLFLICAAGCRQQPAVSDNTTATVVDQLGRKVEVPQNVQKIAVTDPIGGSIIYALGQKDKMVHQALFGRIGRAVASVDKEFAVLPQLGAGYTLPSGEILTALGTQVVFVKESFDNGQAAAMENAGIKAVAIKGNTMEDSFVAVELVAKVLGCEDRGREYITECKRILAFVRDRIGDIPAEKRPRVMFTGPRSAFAVATGDMQEQTILETAGGQNVGAQLKGFWADVSPEQVSAWNPDVIFLGSSLGAYSIDQFYNNPHLQTVKAVKENRVYAFPSDIDWWDYPAPHNVIGILWAAKTLHPDKFADVDMIKFADEFYLKFMGYSFTALGGKL